jgi:hypothetical protein
MRRWLAREEEIKEEIKGKRTQNPFAIDFFETKQQRRAERILS